MLVIDVVALDGDDTLWHSQPVFDDAEARFRTLLDPYCPSHVVDGELLATERRNLELFGYGAKGFTLSMIETAITLTQGEIASSEIHEIVEMGKELLAHPVELLDGVADAVAALSPITRLVLITKGDLFHQESKVARSGIADAFELIEIVSEKDVQTYRRIVETLQVAPQQFVMVGNSVPSDIAPVLELGGRAVWIPYHSTWAHEDGDPPTGDGSYQLDHIGDLADLVATL